MEEIKILFVDDEENVLRALKRLFIDDNYTILTSRSGEHGLEILKQEEPQIIISDYRMPGMNGIDFLRKAYIRKPDAVRIVLSGYADTAVVVQAINEGQIYKLIPKPWNDDELKIAISNAVDRYLLYRRNVELTDELMEKNDELTRLNEELKSLLKEKSNLLEFKGKILINFQNIINAIPIGIMGVDFDDIMVQCNESWLQIAGIRWNNLGGDIHNFLTAEIVNFIENVKNKTESERHTVINGLPGKLIGTLIKDDSEQQKGIILTFIADKEKRGISSSCCEHEI